MTELSDWQRCILPRLLEQERARGRRDRQIEVDALSAEVGELTDDLRRLSADYGTLLARSNAYEIAVNEINATIEEQHRKIAELESERDRFVEQLAIRSESGDRENVTDQERLSFIKHHPITRKYAHAALASEGPGREPEGPNYPVELMAARAQIAELTRERDEARAALEKNSRVDAILEAVLAERGDPEDASAAQTSRFP